MLLKLVNTEEDECGEKWFSWVPVVLSSFESEWLELSYSSLPSSQMSEKIVVTIMILINFGRVTACHKVLQVFSTEMHKWWSFCHGFPNSAWINKPQRWVRDYKKEVCTVLYNFYQFVTLVTCDQPDKISVHQISLWHVTCRKFLSSCKHWALSSEVPKV